MDILQELQKQGLNISPITQKAINKFGLGNINFRSAELKYPDSLKLNFTVASSQGRGNEARVSGNGSDLRFFGGYKVIIQFVNFGNFAPPNLLSLPLSQQVTYINDIFQKADIKVSCDCAAFYWQGNSELLDRKPPEANYTGFTGQYGKGIWDSIHSTSNRVCKHIHHVIDSIESYIPQILKYLNKNGASASTSTTQNTSLVAPASPAGTPTKPQKGVPKVYTPNSEKAEKTIEKDIDIEEKEAKSDTLDLPKLDTSEVKAKSHENESDAVSGAEKDEPPIEEPVVKKEKDEELDKDLEKVKESMEELSLIDRIGEAFNGMANCIIRMAENKLIEQTQKGKICYNEVLEYAKLIKGLLQELEDKTNDGILIDQEDFQSWMEIIGNKNNYVLATQRTALNNKKFDEDDKTSIFRASHIYANLLSELNSKIQDYNLLHPTKKLIKAPELEMRRLARYSPSEEEIKTETEKFKINESLEKNSDPAIIDRIGESFLRMANCITKIVEDRLFEQTNEGKKYYNEAIREAQQLSDLIHDLKQKMKDNVLIDQNSAHRWMTIIRNKNSYILSIQKTVLEDNTFDEDDKMLLFKASHVYANLISIFNSRIQDYNLLHPTKKIEKAPELEIRRSTKYSPSEEEIKIETEKFKSLKEKLIPTYYFPKKTLQWLKTNYPTEERIQEINGKTGITVETDKSYFENLKSIFGYENSRLIVDNKNIPIAFIGFNIEKLCVGAIKDFLKYYLKEDFEKINLSVFDDYGEQDELEIIHELHLFNFSNKPNMTIVKDVCKLLDKFLEKDFPVIIWSVYNNNKIKEVYDKMVPKFNGFSFPKDTMTGYILIRGQSKIPNAYLRESINYDALREELFYRGYRNDSLFQSNNLLPNENSKMLFLATDADHAYEFAMGQTVFGSQAVFEVYDIPVDKLKIYNLENDDKKFRYLDDREQKIKSEGYDGWTKLDSTIADDDNPPGYGRTMTTTWELALFDKNKWKPIDRIVSPEDDFFTDEQLEYLVNKYNIEFLKDELKFRNMDNNFDDGHSFEEYEDYLKQQEINYQLEKEKREEQRNEEDDGQQKLFEPNTKTKRQEIREKFNNIARLLDGYREESNLKEILKRLEAAGISTNDIQKVVNLDKGIENDISDGWTKSDWIIFNKNITEYLNNIEDEEQNEYE